MALVTGYASLQTSIANYLARGDLTADIPGFIQNWEERFYRNPKNYGPWMEAAYSTAMSAGVSAVPTGFLGWKLVYLSMSPTRRLKPVSLSQLYDEYPRSGTKSIPAVIARNGSNFEYGPNPSSDYTVGGSYYLKPTLLRSFASDAAAHYLVVNAPDLLVYGALLEAMPFIKDDERTVIWAQAYQMALDEYRKQQRQQDLSGGPYQVRME